ncbi:DnaJ domain [Dillenia turbinata]|uniref:DnaJ domain n=1 Tax=Dillenia turbinata TaxID=194707 RepID=A0AAN8V089_9MAGN
MATSVISTLKAYWIPLLLLSLSVYLQLFVLHYNFPPSHYDVLGLKRYDSIDEVKKAYDKLSSKWSSGVDVPSTLDFLKIQYAYELLANPIWKRDYDLFGIDEQLHVMEKIKEQHAEKNFSDIALPLLDAAFTDSRDYAPDDITGKDFKSMLEKTKNGLLIQVYSLGSSPALLDDVADTGSVELREVQLATYLAEKKSTGQPFFRHGLPSFVAFPPGCGSSKCLLRFEGDLSVDAVTDWFATTIIGLPRILYYSKDTLGQGFLAKSSPHKVKVIFFSKTGERATPFLREAARNYWAYASFAFVLWREEESSFWWNTFEVESAPAIVVMKDPGVKPVVHHGSVNNSWFLNFMEQNKQQELPQLRSLTSSDLGCDARGYSRAGVDVLTWYCVVLAGRQSLELNKMRETMRKVQKVLAGDGEVNPCEDELMAPSAVALRDKRLTIAWLDGEAQEKYCFFYLHSENSFEACGPRRDPIDVAQLFIVRYKRNATEDIVKVEKKRKTVWDAFQDDDVDPASQLVAKYNGTSDIRQIIEWISQIVKDGDSRDLPFFRTKSPQLVPEDKDPIWSRGAQNVLSKSKGLKQTIKNIISRAHDFLGDPRIGPVTLLLALMSFGGIWLQRSQSTRPSQSVDQSQQNTKDKAEKKHRNRTDPSLVQDIPPSITDVEPKDAYQALPDSDSDSD